VPSNHKGNRRSPKGLADQATSLALAAPRRTKLAAASAASVNVMIGSAALSCKHLRTGEFVTSLGNNRFIDFEHIQRQWSSP
jgi:hypothetical protein